MGQETFLYREPPQYDMENERYIQGTIIERGMVDTVKNAKPHRTLHLSRRVPDASIS